MFDLCVYRIKFKGFATFCYFDSDNFEKYYRGGAVPPFWLSYIYRIDEVETIEKWC